jgi:uncharacterized membrane protein (Fun14 family)
MSKKRGQITIFIVIGIIVLIVFVLSLYFISTISKEKAETAAEKAAAIPLETTAIRNYITSCLKDVSDKGAWIIAVHGGYIDPEGKVDYSYYQGEKVPYLGPTSHTLNDTEREFSNYIVDEIKTTTFNWCNWWF